MKNKIKKILLLGMTAMFTAGAAGTAVISCPVWADEAEQNSETAEEPKAEDAAVEEEIADQTDDKTENTDLKTVEHPRMSVYSIRRFSIVKDGEEVFQIKQEPADYKMDFDYWEITNPYDETATVNTENMYEMFGVLAAFDLSNGVDAANTDTGLDNTKTYFTVDFVNTVNDDTAKETQDADATATILIGNTDENGDYYACVKGYEEAVYMLSKESVNSLLELKPFNLILKIPALVNIDTLGSADMTIGKKTYTMKLDGSDYKFGKKTVKKEGAWGTLQRFLSFGVYGYEEVDDLSRPIKKKDLDVSEARRIFSSRLQREYNASFDSFLKGIGEDIDKIGRTINDEFKESLENNRKRQKELMAECQNERAILAKLEELQKLVEYLNENVMNVNSLKERI